MTQHRSFKALVRARMAKTGESYTTARARLLAARPEPGPGTAAAVLATSDDRIRQRTGRGWEEWFDLLDAAGLRERPHREVSRWLAELQDLDPLAWTVQAVVGSYERARGGRVVGQHPDGFRVTASRTLAVAAETAFTAFTDDGLRPRWLSGLVLLPRTATPPRRAHFDVEDGGGRVHVTVDAKDGIRCTVTVEHARLADQQAAELARSAWRERLTTLRERLERDGGTGR